MTKKEVFRALPSMINHPVRGKGYLELIGDSKNTKWVCYRHDDETASYGTSKTSWQEVYEDLGAYLVKEGYKVDGLS